MEQDEKTENSSFTIVLLLCANYVMLAKTLNEVVIGDRLSKLFKLCNEQALLINLIAVNKHLKVLN